VCTGKSRRVGIRKKGNRRNPSHQQMTKGRARVGETCTPSSEESKGRGLDQSSTWLLRTGKACSTFGSQRENARGRGMRWKSVSRKKALHTTQRQQRDGEKRNELYPTAGISWTRRQGYQHVNSLRKRGKSGRAFQPGKRGVGQDESSGRSRGDCERERATLLLFSDNSLGAEEWRFEFRGGGK